MNDKCILIVEDDQSLIKLYQLFLKKEGYTLFIAKNGKEAIKRYMNLSDRVELIIMDYQMPIMNGIEAMRRILSRNPEEKIIVSSSDSSIKELVIKLGAKNFLPKPFNFGELVKLIKEIGEEREQPNHS